MNRYLSARRLGRFLIKDLVEDYRSILIAAGAVTGVLLLNYTIDAITGGGRQAGGFLDAGPANRMTLLTYFGLTLFLGGFIMTSRAFVELHTKNRNQEWLMLPASHVEKFLSRLLLTSVGIGIGTVIYFFLFSLLGAGLTALLVGRPYPLFNPLDGTVWLMVLNYLVLQSIFFAGAAYFKKTHFVKTVLILTASVIVLMLLAAGVARLVFWNEFSNLSSGQAFSGYNFSALEPRLQVAGETASRIAEIVYWALLAPLFWAFAYFRLRESEVRNGV